MPQTTNQGNDRRKVSVEFHVTPEEELHVFTQWAVANPKTDVSAMTKAQVREVIRDMLGRYGWQAVSAPMDNETQLKKIDYRAALKGIL